MAQQRMTITVEGMTCGGCESSVTNALQRLDGVQVLEASHQAGTVDVLLDDERVDSGALKDAIEEAGYELVSTT